MSSLWWMEPGWEETCCSYCGAKIWPMGDPDWGLCCSCYGQQLQQRHDEEERYRRDEVEKRQKP